MLIPRKARVGIYHYCCSAGTRRHLAQDVLWLRETNYVDQGLEIDVGSPAKGKGCDFGYALAGNSRERVPSVDACTVTALDAITAFAVPNPG